MRHPVEKLLMRATTLLQTSSQSEVCTQSYGPQSHESPNFGNFGTPIWESETKCHLDVGLVERHRVYYKGEGGDFPQVRAMLSFGSPSLPMVCPSTKNASIMH
jgi:hypothetical protein